MSGSGEPFDPYYQWLGIPPDEQPPHHYRLLGLQLFEENRAVIQHAADRQMVHLRTFQNGPRAVLSQQLLNEVAAAKLCLLAPEKKAAYDAQLAASRAPSGKPSPPVPPPEAPPPPASLADAPRAGQPAVELRAGTRRSRSARRLGAWLWLVAILAAATSVALVWQHFHRAQPRAGLILEWPAAQRADATVRIDGAPWNIERDAAASDAETVTLALPPGRHHLAIARPGQAGIDRWVEIAPGQDTRLTVALGPPPDSGTLGLLWPKDQREGAVLEIDGRPCDWPAEALFQDVREVRLPLAPGDHSLRIMRDDQVVLERSVTITPGKRLAVQVLPAASRLVLRWPIALRDKGALEIDGRPVNLSRLVNRQDPDLLEIVMRPGSHVLRLRLGSGDMVEESATIAPGQVWQVDVEHRLAAPTGTPAPDAKPAGTPRGGISAEELDQGRAEFQSRYKEFEEYQRWSAEQDAEKRDELLRTLLDKLTLEARAMAEGSPGQWAAYDESIRLALAADAFSAAHQILRTATETQAFSPQESADQADRIWAAAFQSARGDALLEFLKVSQASGRVPTPEEQLQVVERLSNTRDLTARYASLLDRVGELEGLQVLSRDVAVTIQTTLLEQAAGSDFATIEPALNLAERILRTIPDVFESGVADTPKHITTLLDALKTLRRKTIREAGVTDALRIRIERIDEGIREAREWQSQFARIRAARQTLAEQPDAPAEHRLVAFWLLQLGRFREAGPHLRDSGDAALARLAGPLPESGEERKALADAIEAEADRGRYPRRQKDALRAYAAFVRG